jgi:hypothetical protein
MLWQPIWPLADRRTSICICVLEIVFCGHSVADVCATKASTAGPRVLAVHTYGLPRRTPLLCVQFNLL